MKAIVTGTGRSGTGYMSKVLCESGFACGHEQVFTHRGVEPNEHGLDADSSWMAVPYLSHYPRTPIVLVHRDPVAVISSFKGIDFFGRPSPYRSFMFAKNPALRNLDSFEACCQHYIMWNRRALDYATLIMDLDDMRWLEVAVELELDVVALSEAVRSVDPTYNHRQRANVDLDRIPDEVWEMRAELLEASP